MSPFNRMFGGRSPAPVHVRYQDGEPVEKNLRSERLNIDDVAEEARGQGIEHLNEVKWCVLEANGTMSFIQAA